VAEIIKFRFLAIFLCEVWKIELTVLWGNQVIPNIFGSKYLRLFCLFYYKGIIIEFSEGIPAVSTVVGCQFSEYWRTSEVRLVHKWYW